MTQKRAYISVADKENIEILAKNLIDKKYEIISTGNTHKYLKEKGINVIESSTITGFNELLGGKVKSLHPTIFAGILANEQERLDKEIKSFDLVAVDLYPFENYMDKNVETETLILNIDIGGVALLRAAAKNYENVIVISDKKDYSIDLDEIDEDKRYLNSNYTSGNVYYDTWHVDPDNRETIWWNDYNYTGNTFIPDDFKDFDDENGYKSDLIGYLNFTDADVYYRKKKISQSFLRLSFYNSKDPVEQKLLYYSTIFLDSGELYGKYIKQLSNLKDEIATIIFGELSIDKKRIEIRKLRKKGLSKEYMDLFLKLIDYIGVF